MSHLQGPVPVGNSSYVDRGFEAQVLREIYAARWVLLLGPRQHGKTSALVRIRKQLSESGIHSAMIDMQSVPPLTQYPDLLRWIVSSVARQFGLEPVDYEGDDLGVMLSRVLPGDALPVVILVDEASNIKDAAWRNSFYGQIRAISSLRADADPQSYPARLRFAFSGTFKPETLIDDANSPFNVCERLETDDLTIQQVIELCAACGVSDSERCGRAIYDFVGGQPYLCQRLISAVEGAQDELGILAEAIGFLGQGTSDHVSNLFGKILAEPKLADIVRLMVQNGKAPYEAADADYKYLRVLGIAALVGNELFFRNRLYREIAARSPQIMGGAVVAERATIFFVLQSAFSKIRDSKLREIAASAHRGAVAAYNGGSNRMALAGIGSSIEAILLDTIIGSSQQDVSAAIQSSGAKFSGYQVAGDPASWTLSNLIKVGRQLAGQPNIEPPQNLREWRNLIHPAVCLKAYVEDVALEPEVRVAAGQHEILLRDLN